MAVIYLVLLLSIITHNITSSQRHGRGGVLLLQDNNQRQSTTKSRYLSRRFWEFCPGDGPVKWRGGLKFNHGEVYPHHYTAVPFQVLSLPSQVTDLSHNCSCLPCVCYLFFNGLFLIFRDLQRIGVSLAGHQKKILTSVQLMRHNVDDQSPTESV